MLTIALAQLKSSYLKKEENVQTAIKIMEENNQKAIDIVIFPEMFLTGYAIEGNIEEVAEPVNGSHIQMLAAAARQYEISIIMGFPERAGTAFYNSAVFIHKDGTIGEVYRKVHLFEWEKNTFTAGDKAPIIEVDGAKLSLLMTFDAGFPEMARIAALKGAEIIVVLAAHVVPYQVYHKIMMSARALENQVFIAVVNKVGIENQSVYFGESAIITPHGDYLNKVEHSEKVIIETIDVTLVYRIREQLSMKYLQSRQVPFFKKHGLCEVKAVDEDHDSNASSFL